MKQSVKRAFWRFAWLLAATSFFFFGIAEFVRQHRAEKAAASQDIALEDGVNSFGNDAAIGLVCIALVCLLIALRNGRRQRA